VLNDFYKITFRKKLYSDIDTLQKDLDEYIDWYNTERTHQGIRCKGRIPMETFIEGKQFYDEKNIDDRLVTLPSLTPEGSDYCKVKFCSGQLLNIAQLF
jgi:hypothetical protein